MQGTDSRRLIPYVEVELRHRLSLRLVRALTLDGIREGILNGTKMRLANGYGLSYETVKKYLSARCAALREEAERLEAKRIRVLHRGYGSNTNEPPGPSPNLYYSLITTPIPLTLSFEALPAKTTELALCAAFGKEVQVLTSWVDGDFTPAMPRGMSDDHLVLLAHSFSAAEYRWLNNIFTFHICMLTIAYGTFLHTHRGAPEDREITEAMIFCLDDLK